MSLLIPFFLFCAVYAGSDVLTLNGQRQTVSIYLTDPPATDVLDALADGLKSEIQFQIRLYQRQSGFFSFLGDKLLLELKILRTASIDLFENKYSVESLGFPGQTYTEAQEFIANFFELKDIYIKDLEPAWTDPGQYYLLARVRLNPVRLVPPLNIVTLFSSSVIRTSWMEAEFPDTGGGG